MISQASGLQRTVGPGPAVLRPAFHSEREYALSTCQGVLVKVIERDEIDRNEKAVATTDFTRE